jgi:hypothetical protein
MNRSILGVATTVLLTMTVQAGFAAEAVHVPATPPSRSERKSHRALRPGYDLT